MTIARRGLKVKVIDQGQGRINANANAVRFTDHTERRSWVLERLIQIMLEILKKDVGYLPH